MKSDFLAYVARTVATTSESKADMRIVALMESMAFPGGAQKYGIMMLAPLVGLHEVEVLVRDCPTVDKARLLAMFGVQLEGVSFTYCRSRNEVLRRAKDADLFINVSYASLVPNMARRGIYVVFFPVPIDDLPGQSRHSKIHRSIESVRQRILYGIEDIDPEMFSAETTAVSAYRRKFGTMRTLWRLPLFALRKAAWTGMRDLRLGAAALASYDRLLAISEFTALWTRELYRIEPAFLYPPIDMETFVPDNKRKEIVAAGRFDDGENSKKLHVLVDGFRRIYDSGLLRDWTFHVCGAVSGSESEAYLQGLRGRAAGYPIVLHPNLPFQKLVERYATATLFWHAMGHGENAETHPWRCEHFGMTTAESMSAGCIPMVMNAGGQPEIVGDDRSCGYLWNTTDELQSAVARFLELSPDAVLSMSAAARRRVHRFGHTAFFRSVAKIYRDLGITTNELGESQRKKNIPREHNVISAPAGSAF